MNELHGLDRLVVDLARLRKDWHAGGMKPRDARRRLERSLRELREES